MKIRGKNINLYEIKKNFKNARHNGFIFNQINKLKIKFHSHLRYINISLYLKFRIPMCHIQFYRKIFKNREYINIFCNDVENPFHFACQKWFNQLN